jgi:hypothetical protein
MNKLQSTKFKFFAVIIILFAIQVSVNFAQTSSASKVISDTYDCVVLENKNGQISVSKPDEFTLEKSGKFYVRENESMFGSADGKFTVDSAGIIQFKGDTADYAFYNFKAIPSKKWANRIYIKPEDSKTKPYACVLAKTNDPQKTVNNKDSIYLFTRIEFAISDSEKAEILKEQQDLFSGKSNSTKTATSKNTAPTIAQTLTSGEYNCVRVSYPALEILRTSELNIKPDGRWSRLLDGINDNKTNEFGNYKVDSAGVISLDAILYKSGDLFPSKQWKDRYFEKNKNTTESFGLCALSENLAKESDPIALLVRKSFGGKNEQNLTLSEDDKRKIREGWAEIISKK